MADERELSPKESSDALSSALNKKLREIDGSSGEQVKGLELKPGHRYILALDDRLVPSQHAEATWQMLHDSGFEAQIFLWYGNPDALRLFEIKE